MMKANTNGQSDLTPAQLADVVCTKKLPLIVEVVPGTATEGLLKLHEWGTYELNSTPEELLKRAISEPESVEESSIVERIQREGTTNLLVGARAVRSNTARALTEHLEIRAEGTQEYAYLLLRTIKPQEGGCAASLER